MHPIPSAPDWALLGSVGFCCARLDPAMRVIRPVVTQVMNCVLRAVGPRVVVVRRAKVGGLSSGGSVRGGWRVVKVLPS